MLAKDVMTAGVMTIKDRTPVSEAMDLLIDKQISGVPVVNEEGVCVGIITERNLMVVEDFLYGRDLSQAPVSEFMTREVISVSEYTPVREIIQLFIRNDIRRVPVLKGGKVAGIVARRDVLKSLRMNYSKKMEKKTSDL